MRHRVGEKVLGLMCIVKQHTPLESVSQVEGMGYGLHRGDRTLFDPILLDLGIGFRNRKRC